MKATKDFFAMLDALRTDIDRYVVSTGYPRLIVFLFTQGIWAITQYRISRWIHLYFHVPILRFFLKLLCAVWQKLIEILTGVEIPNRATIAKGLYIPHAQGIVIHTDAKIGENCNLGQQVTIGIGGRGDKRGVPVIGDRVFIGPGAKIFGKIKIGNDVAIGANAVVTKDLPDNAVAVGIPAKIISFQGSKDFIHYREKL